MLEVVPNQKIEHPLLTTHEIELFVKREDLLHPQISGNKFRKLKYNIKEAKKQNQHTLLTFGGAFSNHIAATAAAGSHYGFKTIGIIRGDELGIDLEKTLATNATLAFATKQGMQLHFISRSDYKLKESDEFIEKIQHQFGDFYLVPEGGTNDLAIKGCEEILTPADAVFDLVCCAVGTGGTVSGLINSAEAHQKVIGFPVLKENYLHEEIEKKVRNNNWELNRNYHLGGYAKYNEQLIRFMNSFFDSQHILLDPIYTGKLLLGIFEEIRLQKISKKIRILAVHTGGLQGVSGINSKLKNKNATLIKTHHEF